MEMASCANPQSTKIYKNYLLAMKLFISQLLLLISTCSLAENQTSSIPVRVMAYSELANALDKSAPAQVISLKDAAISPEISAPILKIQHQVGESVEKDTLLAELECDDFRITYRQNLAIQKRLQSQKKLAEQRLKRARQLENARNISAEQLDRRETELDVLLAQQEEQKAVVKLALRTITKCDIRAPFRGVIIQRLAQIGAMARPDQPMFQLLDIDNIEVSARIRPTVTNDLQSAKTIVFEFDGTYFPLSLRAIVPAVDSRSRDQEVRLNFTGPKARPGLRGRLQWKSLQRVLPARVFVRRNKQIGVFIAREGYAHFTLTKDALMGRNSTASLPSDAAIIVDGHAGLQDGDPISLKSE